MSALGYCIVTQMSFTVHTSWDDCEKSFSSMSNTWTLSQIAGTHDHLPEEDQYSNSVLNVLYSLTIPAVHHLDLSCQHARPLPFFSHLLRSHILVFMCATDALSSWTASVFPIVILSNALVLSHQSIHCC